MYRSLYDIQIEHSALIDELIESEGEVSHELEMALMINQDELQDKAEAYALRILEFQGNAESVDKEIKRLMKRKQNYENTAERLKETIKAAMIQFKVDKIKTEKITLSFRKSEVVEIPETWVDAVLQFIQIKAEIDAPKIDEVKENHELFDEDKPLPAFPTEDILQYFKLTATVDKAKMKASLKDGIAVDENIMLLTKQNLQIK